MLIVDVPAKMIDDPSAENPSLSDRVTVEPLSLRVSEPPTLKEPDVME